MIQFIYLFISGHCLWRGVCSLELFVLCPTIGPSLASPSSFDLWSTLPRNETFSAHIHCPPSARLCSIWLSCGWCTATIVVVCAAFHSLQSVLHASADDSMQDWMRQMKCRFSPILWFLINQRQSLTIYPFHGILHGVGHWMCRTTHTVRMQTVECRVCGFSLHEYDCMMDLVVAQSSPFHLVTLYRRIQIHRPQSLALAIVANADADKSN